MILPPGIDPGRYQSGKKDSSLGITKHGNHIAKKILYRTITQMQTVKATQPYHITDYYDKKKRSSNSLLTYNLTFVVKSIE